VLNRSLRIFVSEFGFLESSLTQQEKHLLGLDVSRWKRQVDNHRSDATIFLERRGFGVLVDRMDTGTRFGEHEAIVHLLEQRQHLHTEVRQGKHPLAILVTSLCDKVKSQLGTDLVRWAWEGVPYVFTFYIDEDGDTSEVGDKIPTSEPVMSITGLPPSLSNMDTGTLQGILALSEPSKIGLEDTMVAPPSEAKLDRIEQLTNRVGCLEAEDMPPDIDINDAIYCGATWASLVVVGSDGEPGDTTDTYELLEVRTQIAWIAAHLVRRWCEKAHDLNETINSIEIDEIRWQIIPLLRETSWLSNASMSTRHSEIFRGLKRTSGLDQEIKAAEDTLQWSFEAAERSERRHRRRYELAVELLLGVITVLQLAELVSEIPLVSLPRWASYVILIVSASALALVVVRNRGT